MVALAILKALMLAGTADQLVQDHWRFTVPNPGWVDWLNYALFGTLFASSLIIIGNETKGRSPSGGRLLVSGIFGAGLVFALLTRSTMSKGYLVAWMGGTLDFPVLWDYVVLDVYFARPYLAAYVFVFGLVCWGSWRSGREHLPYYLLAALTLIYLGFNHRDFDVWSAKWVQLNCLGLAGLLGWFAFRRGMRLTMVLFPAAWVFLWWLAFMAQDAALHQPHPYWPVLVWIAVTVVLPLSVAIRRSCLQRPASHFLPFFALSFLLLSNANYGPSRSYDLFLGWALVAPRYLAAEALLLGALLVAAVVLHRKHALAGRWLMDAGGLLLVAIALADLLVQRQMGVPVDWNLLAMSNDPGKVFSLVKPQLGGLLLGLLVLLGGYVAALKCFLHLQVPLPSMKLWREHPSARFVMTSVALLVATSPWTVGRDALGTHAVVRVAQTSPLLRGMAVSRWSGEEMVAKARTLELPVQETTPLAGQSATNKPLNVVLVIMESSYNRYLSLFGAAEETQPLLSGYRDRMELFPNFYSVFPNSLHARFAIFSGLYPTLEYPSKLCPLIPAPSLFELLHDAGYDTQLYYSSTRHYTRMNDYLGHRSLDVFHDCDSMPGREKHDTVNWGVSELATLEAMKGQLATNAASGRPFILSYIPAAPHQPFDYLPEQFRKFDDRLAHLTRNYAPAYRNQLLYMDWILSSLLEELEQTGLLDNTLVIITNDHGEMVGEEGKIGHGWLLTPELSNTPLIVMDPRRQGYRVNSTYGSQIDILPTVLDLLDLEPPAGELFQGFSLYAPEAQEPRPIYLHSYRDRAMVLNGEYLWLEDFREDASAPTPTRRFTITNDGPKTIFTEIAAGDRIARRHLDFESYQRSLLVHYGYYRDAVKVGQRSNPNSARTTAMTVAE